MWNLGPSLDTRAALFSALKCFPTKAFILWKTMMWFRKNLLSLVSTKTYKNKGWQLQPKTFSTITMVRFFLKSEIHRTSTSLSTASFYTSSHSDMKATVKLSDQQCRLICCMSTNENHPLLSLLPCNWLRYDSVKPEGGLLFHCRPSFIATENDVSIVGGERWFYLAAMAASMNHPSCKVTEARLGKKGRQ